MTLIRIHEGVRMDSNANGSRFISFPASVSSRPMATDRPCAPPCITIALSAVAPGGCAVVHEVCGGRPMVQRMLMLGIRRGTALRLLHGPDARGAVVGVGGARIALGRDVIEHIRVHSGQAGPAPQPDTPAACAEAAR